MSVEVTLHCDGPDCTLFAQAELTEDWITIHPGPGADKHFHSGWCAMRWFSTWAEPDVVVENT